MSEILTKKLVSSSFDRGRSINKAGKRLKFVHPGPSLLRIILLGENRSTKYFFSKLLFAISACCSLFASTVLFTSH